MLYVGIDLYKEKVYGIVVDESDFLEENGYKTKVAHPLKQEQ